jgi:hypothetical protein
MKRIHDGRTAWYEGFDVYTDVGGLDERDMTGRFGRDSPPRTTLSYE